MAFFRVCICLITILSLISQYSVCATANTVVDSQNKLLSVVEKIPEKYAHVSMLRYAGNDAPWVVYIKDYHCQYGIQRNIYNTIHYILQNQPETQSVPLLYRRRVRGCGRFIYCLNS